MTTITLNNLVSNGSFESGTESWTVSDSAKVFATDSYHVYGNYGLRLDSASSVEVNATRNISTTSGHKYFVTTKGIDGNSGGGATSTVLRFGSGYQPIGPVVTNRKSFIFSATASSTLLELEFTAEDVGGVTSYFDGVMVIDLTNDFGSTVANSLTVAQMEAIVEHKGGYWESSTTIDNSTWYNRAPEGSFEKNILDWTETVVNGGTINRVAMPTTIDGTSVPAMFGSYALKLEAVTSGTTSATSATVHVTRAITSGRKVYATAYGVKKHTGSGSASIILTPQGTGGTSASAELSTTPATRKSVIGIAGSTGIKLELKASSTSSDVVRSVFDGVMLLDLTGIFGAGSEPDVTTMDALISGFGGFWNNVPNQVTGVSLSHSYTASTSKVTVTWSAPSSSLTITKYRLYEKPSGGSYSAVATPTASPYERTIPASGITYYYMVAAVSDAGEGADSAESNISTYAAPAAPSVSSIGPTETGGLASITISWNASDAQGSAVTSYKIYRGTSPASIVYYATVAASPLTYVDTNGGTGLNFGTTYYYQISGVNANGEGDKSAVSHTSTYNVPDAPTITSISSGLTGGKNRVTVNWNTPADNGVAISNYKIYRGTSSGSTGWIATVSSATHTYVDNDGGAGLPSGVTYYYQITALNALGESDKSVEEDVFTADIPGKIVVISAAPVVLGAIHSGMTGVKLTWSAPPSDEPILGYDIQRSTNGVLFEDYDTISPALTYIDDGAEDIGLSYGAVYYYKVRATNAYGDGEYSAAVSTTTYDTPSIPLSFTLTLDTPLSAKLTWTTPSFNGGTAITNYNIYRGSEVEPFAFYRSTVGTETLYIDNPVPAGLVAGGNYEYAVKAENDLGEGDQTSVKYLAIPQVPSVPQNLSVTLVNGIPVLTWTPPAYDGNVGIDGYYIYCGTAPSPTGKVATVDVSVDTATHANAGNGTTYYYKVSAYNTAGEGPRTADVSIAAGVDTKIITLSNMISNGSFDFDTGIVPNGWEKTTGTTVVYDTAPSGMFFEQALSITGGKVYKDISIPAGHTVFAICKAKRKSGSGTGVFKFSVCGTEVGTLAYQNVNEASATRKYLLYNVMSDDIGTVDNKSTTGIRLGLVAPAGSYMTFDGVMLIDLTATYGGKGAVFCPLGYNFMRTMIDNFIGGYWEGGFQIPKVIDGELQGRVKTKLTLRGAATDDGRLLFYFKDNGGLSLFMNKWWFSEPIAIGVNYAIAGDMLSNPNNIMTYETMPQPYEEPSTDYVRGWPVYINTTTGQNLPVLYSAPSIYTTSDLLGYKTAMEFITYPARFLYFEDEILKAKWSEVNVTMSQDETLEGFGTLMVSSDYTINIRMSNFTIKEVRTSHVNTPESYMSLNFMIDSWFIGDSATAIKEDIGKQAPYFRIPIYTGDTLASIGDRITNGDSTGPIPCDSLKKQINDYFDKIAERTGIFDIGDFDVIATMVVATPPDNLMDNLKIRIFTSNESVQHEISCYEYKSSDFHIRAYCNAYFINDNVFELRSYYDMYGIDKPIGNSASATYKPLSYGFNFSLNYITDYSETEASAIDVTPIPGQSSAKAIGIDAVGAVRDITINGIRVDNSNIWTFHIPWQDEGENRGIIYTGTSNWGWVKFMKAIIGTFQMTSGPYRLIMMTVPSSSQMQYYPTRDGTYQYSDGTYVMLAGWEDMCYVMIENFTYSRSEDMFNAIQYSLKLKRVAPLMNTG